MDCVNRVMEIMVCHSLTNTLNSFNLYLCLHLVSSGIRKAQHPPPPPIFDLHDGTVVVVVVVVVLTSPAFVEAGSLTTALLAISLIG